MTRLLGSLLGGLLILAACAGCGYGGAALLTRQRRRLAAWQQGLLALMKEIEYSLTPLVGALAAAARAAGTEGEMFRQAARLLEEGEGRTAGEAWLEALDRSAAAGEEREILAPLAAGFGLSAVEQQLKQLELCRLRLAAAEAEAHRKEQQFGKIWRSMGWAAGALIVLLMV